VPDQLNASAHAIYQAWPDAERRAIVAALSYKGTLDVAHPFLKLVHPFAASRVEAWEKAWPLLRRQPELAAELLGAALADRARRLSAFTTSSELERLAELGAPGRRELARLLEEGSGAALDVQESAAARRLLEAVEARAGVDFAALPDASSQEPLIARARLALADPPQTLAERLRRRAIEDAVLAVQAAPPEERAAALERLSALLDQSPRTATGANALALKARIGLWTAFAAATLAIALAAAPAVLALSAASPLLAGVAAAAGGAVAARSLTRPLDFRDSRVAIGPRQESAQLPEWIPAQRALARLAERLGLSPQDTPTLGLWSDEPGQVWRGWNGWSGGTGLNARAVVALDENWLSAEERELEALLAHELGHLATGELRWRNVLSRLRRAAGWTLLGALAAAPTLGGLGLWLAAAAAVAWVVSGLVGLAWLRQTELRADRFAAKLVGEEAVRSFLARLGSSAPSGSRLATLFSDHPSIDERQRRLR
jgi:Zn-dependent protease with chaperone function